jgi:DUF1016 N-terminal domain
MSYRKKAIVADDNLLYNDLQKIVQIRYGIITRTANAGLLNLFRQVGDTPGRHFATAKTIKNLSALLVADYGSYFTVGNLKKMQAFALQFPDLSANELPTYLLSWQHILLLLNIQNPEARQFYLTLKTEQGLNPAGLKQQIAAQLYENRKQLQLNASARSAKKPKNNKAAAQIPDFRLLQLNDRALPSVFTKTAGDAFRRLTAPQKKSSVRLPGRKKHPNNPASVLLKELSSYIEYYRKQQNTVLNTHFNLMLWETGKRINEAIHLHKTTDRTQTLISNTAKCFSKQYGNVFSKKQFNAMSRFAAIFPDIATASWIASLLSWEHIAVLITLKEADAIISYAQQTVQKGLTPGALQKEITRSTPGTVTSAQKSAPPIFNFVKNTTRHAVTNITVTDYYFAEIKESALALNVFKSPAFNRFTAIQPSRIYNNNFF